MSESSQPRGLQPTRLLCPWDFPGKSTGVGCHCFLRYICIHTHTYIYMVCAKSLQSRPTLCDPMDCRPPSSSLHGILQARILEWVAMPFCRDLPDPKIRPTYPVTPALQAGSLPLGHWRRQYIYIVCMCINYLVCVCVYKLPCCTTETNNIVNLLQ